jgi:hypothetical protein
LLAYNIGLAMVMFNEQKVANYQRSHEDATMLFSNFYVFLNKYGRPEILENYTLF